MNTYVFGCINDGDHKYGYQIEAEDYESAQKRLFVYCVVTDPFGWIIRLKHIQDNFILREENDEVTNVTDWLIKRGIVGDTNIEVAADEL